jgi:hypothetical protein
MRRPYGGYGVQALLRRGHPQVKAGVAERLKGPRQNVSGRLQGLKPWSLPNTCVAAKAATYKPAHFSQGRVACGASGHQKEVLEAYSKPAPLKGEGCGTRRGRQDAGFVRTWGAAMRRPYRGYGVQALLRRGHSRAMSGLRWGVFILEEGL